MNKKTLIIAIAISVVAVLVVAIGYAALKDFFKPVAVQEVEFSVSEDHEQYVIEDSGFDGYTLKFCVDDITSYQLSWEITPDNAENKDVTFTSSNNKFTVSETGLVSFTEKDISTVITIKTDDGEKTDTIAIQTYSNQAINAGYDFDTNSFEPSSDYFVEGTGTNQTLYLYNGKEYEFILDYNVTFSASTQDIFTLTNEENVYTVNTSNIGNGTIVATSEGTTKTINIKIVEKVLGFNLINSNFNEDYFVGNKNEFTFPISVSVSVNSDNAELEYVLKNSDNQDVTQDATFNAMRANFNNLDAGVYTLKVSAKYDASLSQEVSFTLNDAYNVKSHAEMATYYNDNNVTAINLVGDYVIELTAQDKDPNKNVDLLVTSTNDGLTYLNQSAKFIYYRTKGITFNGNNHSINAYKIPHIEVIMTELGHNRCILFGCGDYEKTAADYYSKETSTTNSNLTIAELLSSGQTLNDEDIATQREHVLDLYKNAPKFVFNNLSVNGNLTDSDYVSTTKLGKQGYYGFSSLNCFGLNSADVTFDNVDITNFLMGIMQATYSNGSFGLTIKNSSIKGTFGYNVFTLSTAKMHVEDSAFGDAGHACIYNKSIDSSTYIDKYTTINTSNANESQFVAKYVGDVTFDNWINKDTGTSFFSQSGDIAILQGLHQVLSTAMGSYANNVIKTEGTNYFVNFGIQHEAVTTTSAKDVPATQYDFTQTTGYNTNFNKDSYWTAFGAVYTSQLTPAQAYTNIIEKNSYVNDNLICCSINVNGMLGSPYYNAISYFYMGRNVVTSA